MLILIAVAVWFAVSPVAGLLIGKMLAAGNRAREITPVTPPRQPDPEEAEFEAYLRATRRPS